MGPRQVTPECSGQILGTIAYMSPEQIQGQDVDQRSDLFAFGIMFYEMLTGEHPWPRRSPVETLRAIRYDAAPPIHATSLMGAELAAIAQKLLRKSPAERYASAEAVLEAFGSRAVPQGPSAATSASASPLTSIAVLPFVFLSEVEERRALSLGFADALITMLGSLEDITVLPTSAILNHMAGTDPASACHDLGVRHILLGNVQKLGAHWRVSMQLFDGMTQKIVFAETHDFMLENVFDVQDEIGRRVVESLRRRFPAAVPKSRDRYSSDPEAYDEFMSGLRESYADRRETLESAIEHLSKAVERDPEFALAHAWLSYVSMNMHYTFDPRPIRLEKAEHHCHRALTLDPVLPEGHLARAFILSSPRRISSTPMPSRRWNRCWRCGQILSRRTIGSPISVCMSDDFKRRASPTNTHSDRIRRRGAGISSSFISSAETSRARKKPVRPGFGKDPEQNTRSFFTRNRRC